MTHASDTKRVAIIIDDGPHPENAPAFLKLFEKEGIKASFAHVGATVSEFPDTTQSMIKAGHEIVNHSYSHAHPNPLSDEELEKEIVGGQNAFIESVGYTPKWYWPPFLEIDARMTPLFEKANIVRFEPIRLVSSEDWNQETTAEAIYEKATTGVEDRTVILFHEWRTETVQQMPAILAELKRQGCVFHTFSELDALEKQTRGPRNR